MKKVLIVSDSHGLDEELQIIKKRHEAEVDLMIHCGDSELPESFYAMQGFTTVKGNCDFETKFPDEKTVELAGRIIFITHGHHYSVKNTLMNLDYRAKELNADIVCFGHSHVLRAELVDGTLFINPGSIRLPRKRLEKTYVLLEIAGDTINMRVFDTDSGEIPELAREFSLPQ
ncbi:MAG: metallophosphoesterase [Bacillota bacterium]|nr:metallophosphoesterase [Bacillota bacterium]